MGHADTTEAAETSTSNVEVEEALQNMVAAARLARREEEI